MPRKITNNLNKRDLIHNLEDVSNKLFYVTKTIRLNLGKDPVLWRRAVSLESKVEELMNLIEQRDI